MKTEKELIQEKFNVTKDGRVFRKSNGSEVVFSKDHKGYLKSRLLIPELSQHKDRRKPYRLHRLVAMVYLSNYSDELQVNHINGVKNDNRIYNLEMVTASENSKHGWGLDSSGERKKLLMSRKDKTNGRFTTRLL